MELWLAILLGILVSLGIVLVLYLLFVFRKMAITTKKVDYLVEDITYKLETLSPTIDSLLKISTYINVIDLAIKRNSSTIEKVIKNNHDNIEKFNKITESYFRWKRKIVLILFLPFFIRFMKTVCC